MRVGVVERAVATGWVSVGVRVGDSAGVGLLAEAAVKVGARVADRGAGDKAADVWDAERAGEGAAVAFGAAAGSKQPVRRRINTARMDPRRSDRCRNWESESIGFMASKRFSARRAPFKLAVRNLV